MNDEKTPAPQDPQPDPAASGSRWEPEAGQPEAAEAETVQPGTAPEPEAAEAPAAAAGYAAYGEPIHYSPPPVPQSSPATPRRRAVSSLGLAAAAVGLAVAGGLGGYAIGHELGGHEDRFAPVNGSQFPGGGEDHHGFGGGQGEDRDGDGRVGDPGDFADGPGFPPPGQAPGQQPSTGEGSGSDT